jgi:hypothetical protein
LSALSFGRAFHAPVPLVLEQYHHRRLSEPFTVRGWESFTASCHQPSRYSGTANDEQRSEDGAEEGAEEEAEEEAEEGVGKGAESDGAEESAEGGGTTCKRTPVTSWRTSQRVHITQPGTVHALILVRNGKILSHVSRRKRNERGLL